MKILALAAIISLALVAGCVQQPGNQKPPEDLYEPPEGMPSIKIISPPNGDVIDSSAVGIRVNVTNFRLADIRANPENKANEGHIYYYLDSREQKGPMTTTSYTNIQPGRHTIRAELRNNDGSSLVPPIYDAIIIETT